MKTEHARIYNNSVFGRSKDMFEKTTTYKTPTGRYSNLFADMLEQPHLLIAGATGSGKSVVINGMMAALLHRLPGNSTPDKVKLILIDPKRVELVAYKDLPHTVRYASEPEEMLSALQYAMELAENRFKVMQERRKKKYPGGDVYIVIDEFADLMTTQGRAVVPIIQRLAQIGRAAKVHIILATQTPVREVIPTKIKCNFDARVGLRTRSDQDSRNIIGKSGLERLPSYGKGYYMKPNGAGDPSIKEGYYNIPYVDDDEIERLVKWWMTDGQKSKFKLF